MWVQAKFLLYVIIDTCFLNGIRKRLLILGIIFSPLAWTMGIPWKEANIVGRLMGEKIILTELIAYGSLGDLINNSLILYNENCILVIMISIQRVN